MPKDPASSGREKGPFSYEHWKAVPTGVATPRGGEIACFTDACLTGEDADGYGPYRLLNTGGGSEAIREHRPAVVLRVETPEQSEYDPPRMDKTDTARYHGGGLEDEITALVSLELGIRLKPGRVIRRFLPGDDPRGRPFEIDSGRDPILLTGGRLPVMPYSAGKRSLNDVTLLKTLPLLQPRSALALVRAARLYQDALWISESEPHLSWVMFVSAVESAAQYWKTGNITPIDLLMEVNRDLYDVLVNAGNEELLERVASEVAPLSKATKKFVAFIVEHLPDDPPVRPAEFAQHPWGREAIEKSLRVIYTHRSKALHEGTPFPMPMCRAPWSYGDGKHPAPEIPYGDAVHDSGGTWKKQNLPMLLHTFEYIVRHALLKWWRSMLSA